MRGGWLVNKIRLSIFIFVITICIASIILFFVNQPIKTGVRFISIPDNIQVKGGEYNFTASYGTDIAMKPGDYTLTISKDGYTPSTTTVRVIKDTLSSICVSLEPQTDAAKKDILNTKDLLLRQEAVGGCQAEVGSKTIEDEYPFINKLPIIDKYFSATTCLDGDKKTIICVTLLVDNEVQKQRALTTIKNKGIDIDTIKIRFLESTSDD